MSRFVPLCHARLVKFWGRFLSIETSCSGDDFFSASRTGVRCFGLLLQIKEGAHPLCKGGNSTLAYMHELNDISDLLAIRCYISNIRRISRFESTRKMQVDSTTVASPPPTVRSRKANGSSLFLGRVDARSVAGRRQKELEADLVAELGGKPTSLQRHRVHVMAGLMVRQELLVASQARGEDSGDELVRVCNLLNRERLLLGLAKSAAAEQGTTPSIDWHGLLVGGADAAR